MATFLKSLLEVSKLSLIEVILFADTTNIGNGGGGVYQATVQEGVYMGTVPWLNL